MTQKYIRITKATNDNWYKDCIGEKLAVRDETKYESIGIQVWRPDRMENQPDVVQHGHYTYI